VDQTVFRDLLADRVVVADKNGVIVADTTGALTGTVHPYKHISHGIPVMAGGMREGTVLVGSMIDSALTGSAEKYLLSVTESILFATIISVCAALLLGILFTLRLTRPLASLALAAKSIASGNSSEAVEVTGDDELADLAAAFNDMTTELRRLDAAKKQVIADSAHELRTPVTLIQGTIEGMIDGVFPMNAETLKSVHEETLRLSRLIDTLRELEIIESGELSFSREGIDLRETIRKAISLFTVSSSQKNIRLEFVPNSGTPSIAEGDYVRIGEVIYNLISNAIKYTPTEGKIIVREEAGTADSVGFSVEDSGPGIAQAERAHIFERFYRIDKSRSQESGGRGLGLAIASEIVKAHCGTIAVGKTDLGGARFTVMLPRFQASGQKHNMNT
jgi:signal transduction histidine kinase